MSHDQLILYENVLVLLNLLFLPHPLVLLCSGEDLCLTDEDVAEWSTAATLLIEAGDRTDGKGLDHQGLGVG